MINQAKRYDSFPHCTELAQNNKAYACLLLLKKVNLTNHRVHAAYNNP